MTIAFGAIGAKSAGGTTSVAVAHPTGITAGQFLALMGVGWPSSAGVNGIAGWAVTQTGGGTGTAIDAHTTTAAIFTKEAVGTETGNVTLPRGGTPDGQLGIMARYTKTADAWDPIATAGGSDTSHAADRSVTMTTTINVKPGDKIVALAGIDTDTALAGTITPTISAPGITFNTPQRRTSGAGVNTGQDGNLEVFDVDVLTGEGDVTITFGFTTTTTQCGPVRILRLREAVPVTPPPSGTFIGFGIRI